jgi:hypothetical protein
VLSLLLRVYRGFHPFRGKKKRILTMDKRWGRVDKYLRRRFLSSVFYLRETKTNSVALVRERTMPTERPPFVGIVSANFADEGCHMVSVTDPCGRNLGFLDRVVMHAVSTSGFATCRPTSIV